MNRTRSLRRRRREDASPAGAAKRGAQRWLRRAANRIAARTKPSKIILFGSYAYGRPGPDSDVDLLVVLDRPRDRFKRYLAVEKAVGEHLWPLDILVRSPEEIAARLRIGDSFFADIMSRGKVLYES